MSEYTHVNLKELPDSAERFGLAPNMEARFARKAMGAEKSGLSYQRLAPNYAGSFAHRHGDQEETYVVVGGSGRMKVGDDVVELGQWDAVRVSPQTVRAFAAGPDGLELLAFGAGDSGDAEMLEPDWG